MLLRGRHPQLYLCATSLCRDRLRATTSLIRVLVAQHPDHAAAEATLSGTATTTATPPPDSSLGSGPRAEHMPQPPAAAAAAGTASSALVTAVVHAYAEGRMAADLQALGDLQQVAKGGQAGRRANGAAAAAVTQQRPRAQAAAAPQAAADALSSALAVQQQDRVQASAAAGPGPSSVAAAAAAVGQQARVAGGGHRPRGRPARRSCPPDAAVAAPTPAVPPTPQPGPPAAATNDMASGAAQQPGDQQWPPPVVQALCRDLLQQPEVAGACISLLRASHTIELQMAEALKRRPSAMQRSADAPQSRQSLSGSESESDAQAKVRSSTERSPICLSPTTTTSSSSSANPLELVMALLTVGGVGVTCPQLAFLYKHGYLMQQQLAAQLFRKRFAARRANLVRTLLALGRDAMAHVELVGAQQQGLLPPSPPLPPLTRPSPLTNPGLASSAASPMGSVPVPPAVSASAPRGTQPAGLQGWPATSPAWREVVVRAAALAALWREERPWGGDAGGDVRQTGWLAVAAALARAGGALGAGAVAGRASGSVLGLGPGSGLGVPARVRGLASLSSWDSSGSEDEGGGVPRARRAAGTPKTTTATTRARASTALPSAQQPAVLTAHVNRLTAHLRVSHHPAATCITPRLQSLLDAAAPAAPGAPPVPLATGSGPAQRTRPATAAPVTPAVMLLASLTFYMSPHTWPSTAALLAQPQQAGLLDNLLAPALQARSASSSGKESSVDSAVLQRALMGALTLAVQQQLVSCLATREVPLTVSRLLLGAPLAPGVKLELLRVLAQGAGWAVVGGAASSRRATVLHLAQLVLADMTRRHRAAASLPLPTPQVAAAPMPVSAQPAASVPPPTAPSATSTPPQSAPASLPTPTAHVASTSGAPATSPARATTPQAATPNNSLQAAPPPPHSWVAVPRASDLEAAAWTLMADALRPEPRPHAAIAADAARTVLPALCGQINAAVLSGTLQLPATSSDSPPGLTFVLQAAQQLLQGGPHPYLVLELCKVVVGEGCAPLALPVALKLARHCARSHVGEVTEQLLLAAVAAAAPALVPNSSGNSSSQAAGASPVTTVWPDGSVAHSHSGPATMPPGQPESRRQRATLGALLDALVLECIRAALPARQPGTQSAHPAGPAAATAHPPLARLQVVNKQGSGPLAPPSSSAAPSSATNAPVDDAPLKVSEAKRLASALGPALAHAASAAGWAPSQQVVTALADVLMTPPPPPPPATAPRPAALPLSLISAQMGLDQTAALKKQLEDEGAVGAEGAAMALLRACGPAMQARVLLAAACCDEARTPAGPGRVLQLLADVLDVAGAAAARRAELSAAGGPIGFGLGPGSSPKSNGGVPSLLRPPTRTGPNAGAVGKGATGHAAGSPGQQQGAVPDPQRARAAAIAHTASALLVHMGRVPLDWSAAAPVLLVATHRTALAAHAKAHTPLQPPASGTGSSDATQGVPPGSTATPAAHTGAPAGSTSQPPASASTSSTPPLELPTETMAQVVLAFALMGEDGGQVGAAAASHTQQAAGATSSWVFATDGLLEAPLPPSIAAQRALTLLSAHFSPAQRQGPGAGPAVTPAAGPSRAGSPGGLPPLGVLLQRLLRSRLATHPALETLCRKACAMAIASSAGQHNVDRPLLVKAVLVRLAPITADFGTE